MAENAATTKEAKKKISKKEVRKELFTKLSGAMEEYKARLGEKKFETRVKKAAKLFAVDLAKAFKKDLKPVRAKKTPAAKK
ncbi:MAG: hypothetical protein QM726_04840 [Chitinophagaceae bacterium]